MSAWQQGEPSDKGLKGLRPGFFLRPRQAQPSKTQARRGLRHIPAWPNPGPPPATANWLSAGKAIKLDKSCKKGLASRPNILNNPHRLFNTTTRGRTDYEP